MATAETLSDLAFRLHLRPSEKFVSVDDYLNSSYEPDMDYVDGHLEERNVGETEHSALQNAVLTTLNTNAGIWGIRVYPECRLQVRHDRYRVPDILVIPRSSKPPRIVREAPLLCIEVLSPKDTWRRLIDRTDDYAAMGVKHVWVFDPKYPKVFVVENGERKWADSGVLMVSGTEVRIDLEALAAELAD